MANKYPGLLFLLILLSLQVQAAFSVSSTAQTTGEILLEVKDQAGLPLIAAGKLASLFNGWERNFQTDAQGKYVLSNLPFGRYRLEISSENFAAQSLL